MKAGLRTLIGSTFVAMAMAVALPTIQAQGTPSTTQKASKTTTKAAAKASRTTAKSEVKATKTAAKAEEKADKSAAKTEAKTEKAATKVAVSPKTTKPRHARTKSTKMEAAPKSTVTAAPAVNPSPATPMASPTAVAKASPKSAVGKLDVSNNTKAGATARCKDGTYSHAANRSGACSGHGGVASWM